MKIRVCGLDFDDIGTEHAVRAALTGGNACFVVTPNALMLEDCARSPEHLRLLSGASLILPDGGGVVRAAARLGTPFAHGGLRESTSEKRFSLPAPRGASGSFCSAEQTAWRRARRKICGGASPPLRLREHTGATLTATVRKTET